MGEVSSLGKRASGKSNGDDAKNNMKLKHGIYNIYKPPGPTSHDMVDQVRKLSGEQRVGHAGTLDPFAEGILIVAIGREYTKKLGQFLKQDKVYKATIKLGAESDTGDLTGNIIEARPQLGHGKREVERILKSFIGEIEQVPPAFSAIKIKGRKAYELARKGIMPDLKPRRVKIYSLKVLKYRWPYLEIETRVSSGTYIRSLARDIGQALKTGGYLEKLVRTKIGRFDIKKSIKLLGLD
ncbi:MAG: tRNA pseudouridine55 synthase [Parcubacteria group bacterium Gr01-1014_44]|nr:MAG: tRNA pseudouridine55 synthase [Parcubacteria group bacterium Gr01-1014_44]